MKKHVLSFITASSLLLGMSSVNNTIFASTFTQPQNVQTISQAPEEKSLAEKLIKDGKISLEDAQKVKIIGLETSRTNKNMGDKEKIAYNQNRDSRGEWKQTNGRWWFQYKDGHYSTAWDQIDGIWYYFDSEGWMKSNEWINPGGKWYYLTESGAMATSYLRVKGTPYFFRVNNGEWVENTGEALSEYAKTFVGHLAYEWGGESLTSGADCSGFTKALHASFDISIPRKSEDQALSGKYINSGSQQPGDLILYSYETLNDHVGIYVGGNNVVHSPMPGRKVEYMNQYGIQQSVIRRYW